MMNCSKCNEPVAEGSRFCENCGAKIEIAAVENGFQPAYGETSQMAAASEAGNMVPPKNKMSKKAGILIGVAILAALLIIALLVTHKKKIDLNDFVTVEFSGYDTYGTAEVTFDYDGFFEEVKEKAKGKKSSKKEANELLSELMVDFSNWGSYVGLVKDVDWSLNKSEELSNKDKVMLNFEYDNKAAKKYGIRFTGDDTEYVVSGLEDIREIDPFEDVTLEFSGTSPDASASIVYNSPDEAVENLNFNLSKSDGLKKGDTVKVTVDFDEEYVLETYGCRFTSDSKEFTCDEVDEYLTTLADLDEETMKLMKGQTEDVINAYFGNNKSEIGKGKMKYEGSYFLKRKNNDSWESNNIIYVVYSAKVKSKNKSFRSREVYFPVEFQNVIQYADGTIYVNLDTDTIKGSTKLNFKWWGNVSGYTSKSDMHNELIVSNKGKYTDESSGSLK